MRTSCKFCGASIDSSAKVCPACGRADPVIQAAGGKQFSNFEGSGLTPGASNSARTPYAATKSAKRMEAPSTDYGTGKKVEHADFDHIKAAQQHRTPFVTNSSSGKFENRSRVSSALGMIVRLIVLLIIAAILYAVVRVVMVSRSNYDFKLDKSVKLEASSYGEAFRHYFKGSKWWFDFKTNTVTYTGTTDDDKIYEMTFGKSSDGQTAVTSLTIEDKEVEGGTKTIMEKYIMGMFMTESKYKNGPTALGGGAGL